MAIEQCYVCESYIEDDEALYDADYTYCVDCASYNLLDE